MKKLFALVVILATFVSCMKDGKKVDVIGTQTDFDVKFLFETDGIKVYRFMDGGRAVYFTNGSGKAGYIYKVRNCKTTEGYDVDVVTYCNHWDYVNMRK